MGSKKSFSKTGIARSTLAIRDIDMGTVEFLRMHSAFKKFQVATSCLTFRVNGIRQAVQRHVFPPCAGRYANLAWQILI